MSQLVLTFLFIFAALPQQPAEDVAAQFQRAVTLQQEGKLTEAADEYRALLKRKPDYVEAQANLGYMYDKGYDVPIDKERAVYWTQKAAAAGVDIAQFNLGEFYELGTGVAADLSRAEFWVE